MNDEWRCKTRALLIESMTGAEALSKLYRHFQEQDRKISFGLICLKTGIKSKGHVSDLISGRRPINPKYRDGLAKIFKLEEMEEAYFKLLIMADSAHDLKEKAQLHERILVMRKALLSENWKLSAGDSVDLYAIFEVFASFGLFGNEATEGDLLKLYQNRTDVDVIEALGLLVTWKMIESVSKDRYRICLDQIFFNAGTTGSHLRYVRHSILAAETRVIDSFSDRKNAYFDAKVISVSLEKYQKILAEIRLAITEAQTRMESSSADTLVRFNVQVFPVKF